MFDLWTAAPTHPNGAIPERHQTRVVQNPSAARPERCHRFRPLFLLCYPACAFGRAGGWVVAPRLCLGLCGWGLAGVVLPRLCFRWAWGVGGGTEIIFGVLRVMVGWSSRTLRPRFPPISERRRSPATQTRRHRPRRARIRVAEKTWPLRLRP